MPDRVVICSDMDAVDLKLQGVQRDGLGVFSNIEIDNNLTLKGMLLEVGLKSQVVVLGDYIGGQELSAGLDASCAAESIDSLRSAHVCSSM